MSVYEETNIVYTVSNNWAQMGANEAESVEVARTLHLRIQRNQIGAEVGLPTAQPSGCWQPA